MDWLSAFMVDARVREIREVYGDCLAVTVGGYVCVYGQQNRFESGEWFPEGDPGEVDSGDDGEEAEDDKLEVDLGGVEGVVEPAAELVVAGAGVGLPEVVGDLGSEFCVGEEG